MSGVVFNIQRFSFFDGPGVRTVVFLKGCPLRCIWCHNPEGLERQPQILFHGAKCIACGDCVTACQRGLHAIKDGMHHYRQQQCSGCGNCAAVCCTEALSLAGKVMSADEVLDAVLKDARVYAESGGGITLSGGEPFMQPDFTLELLKKAKEKNLSTCIETSGYAPGEKLMEAARYTDVFLFDYKATGDEMYQRLCGKDQRLILDNLHALDKANARVILRCPIVPGANDCEAHISGIAQIARLGCIEEVQLEPYHNLGVSKAQKLCNMTIYQTDPPSKAYMEAIRRRINELSRKRTTIS